MRQQAEADGSGCVTNWLIGRTDGCRRA